MGDKVKKSDPIFLKSENTVRPLRILNAEQPGMGFA